MNSKFLTITMMSAALVGCAGSSDNVNFLQYQCEMGKSFAVAYFPEQERATLRLSGQEFPMIQMPSGSGARYILDDGNAETQNPLTLYTKGNDARLEYERVIYKYCKTN